MKNNCCARENFKMRGLRGVGACLQAMANLKSTNRLQAGSYPERFAPQIRQAPYDNITIAVNVSAAVMNESSAAFE
jgi:hypothetical protein